MPNKSINRLSLIRSAAGRSGGIARWSKVAREPTTYIRVYKSDASQIRSMTGTSSQVIRSLLNAVSVNH